MVGGIERRARVLTVGDLKAFLQAFSDNDLVVEAIGRKLFVAKGIEVKGTIDFERGLVESVIEEGETNE